MQPDIWKLQNNIINVVEVCGVRGGPRLVGAKFLQHATGICVVKIAWMIFTGAF